MKACASCNKEVVKNYIEFKCPKCAKSRIVRCEHCRAVSKDYKCNECNFEGP